MSEMSEHSTVPDLPNWASTALNVFGLVFSGAAAKLSHRWAQQAKAHAEVSSLKASVKDHEQRINDLERTVERNHNEVLREIRHAEQNVVRELKRVQGL